MAYQLQSFVYGEQPSVTKMNILWTNDASFNNGTGIANLAYNTTAISNPYKFSVQNTAIQSFSHSVATKVTFGTSELFDTNNNFAASRYTAPVTGFYQINISVVVASATNTLKEAILWLYKNGSAFAPILDFLPVSGSAVYSALPLTMSTIISLTAADYLEVYVMGISTASNQVNVPNSNAYFSGFLVSQT